MADLSEATKVGGRAQAVDYVFAANFAAYGYDWLLSVLEEVEIVSRSGLSPPIVIYFLSRISQFSHLCIMAVFMSSLAPAENCQFLAVTLGACAVMSVSFTSFLFFLRVRAVYLRSKYVTALFGTFWLVTVSLNIVLVTIVGAGHASPAVGGYSGCISNGTQSVTLPLASIFVNDSLIFLAISYRLVANALTDGDRRSRLLTIVKGKGLYSLSQSLLQTGQLYYFSTLLYFFLNFAIIWIPFAPPGGQFILVTAHIGFTNIMACRVFRGVALGMIHMEPLPNGLTSTAIANAFQLDTSIQLDNHGFKEDWIRSF
ncbi:hypothetical protein FIBSPDRAFT_938124 [Athelia psychrophila]|uniref:G-protein coupled receptors family 1 profile domain-containing protein n=1 Tax=Athelia psychrophila TaxID=1759441 RepID=A0A165Z6D6_9AGAM|nr:hypothetical protein FIBSPDRAFT_938124 [Fibularhizoctonia sp. CBS 109695]